jgi:hypothetical protein
MSIAFHLVSPLSWTYFSQVILESDPFSVMYADLAGVFVSVLYNRLNSFIHLFPTFILAVEANIRGAAFANASGCGSTDLSCLMALTPEQVMSAQNAAGNVVIPNLIITIPWGPVIDGVELANQVSPVLYWPRVDLMRTHLHVCLCSQSC